MQGHVSYRCAGRLTFLSCFSSNLTEGNVSKLISDQSIDANRVVIQNSANDKTKKSRFDSKSGKSKKSFNLWISTLTQRGLLESGENEISYSFTKNSQEVASGKFNVLVNTSKIRTCSSRYFSYLDPCPDDVQICNRFFREQNYCQ